MINRGWPLLALTAALVNIALSICIRIAAAEVSGPSDVVAIRGNAVAEPLMQLS